MPPPSSRRSAAARSAPEAPANRKPSSARVPAAQTARKPSSARIPAAQAARKPSSARIPAADEQGRPGSARVARREAKPASKRGLYILAGVVVLALVVVFAWGPVRRGMALSKLDGFKRADGSALVPAKRQEAQVAADEFMALVGNDRDLVRSAIVRDRGPAEAQIHMAKTIAIYPALVQISERKLPEALLAETLGEAAAVYNFETDGKERLPRPIIDWASEPKSPRPVALAAIQLLAKVNPDTAEENAAQTFAGIARSGSSDPLVADAALTALATVVAEGGSGSKLGYAIDLLSSPASDQAMANAKLTQAIVSRSSANHLPALIKLLSHPTPGVRALALEALGGPSMSIPEGPDAARKREDLGRNLAPKLAKDTPAIEMAAALKAVRTLKLVGARDEVFALMPSVDSLGLPGIDRAFFASIVGESFIDPADAAGIKFGDEIVKRLTAGLGAEATRTTCALALAKQTRPGCEKMLALRPALDQLAANADGDPACLDALKQLVSKTYERKDVTDACGNDAKAWRDFLAKDRPNFERYMEIISYMEKNGQDLMRVQAGRAKLKEGVDWTAKAQTEVSAWREDPKFVPPLGLSSGEIREADERLKMLGMSVRKAYAGSL